MRSREGLVSPTHGVRISVYVCMYASVCMYVCSVPSLCTSSLPRLVQHTTPPPFPWNMFTSIHGSKCVVATDLLILRTTLIPCTIQQKLLTPHARSLHQSIHGLTPWTTIIIGRCLIGSRFDHCWPCQTVGLTLLHHVWIVPKETEHHWFGKKSSLE